MGSCHAGGGTIPCQGGEGGACDPGQAWGPYHAGGGPATCDPESYIPKEVYGFIYIRLLLRCICVLHPVCNPFINNLLPSKYDISSY